MRTVTKTMRQIYRLYNINLYFTSSNLTYTDNQRFTKVLVQIWNTISILDVVPQ